MRIFLVEEDEGRNGHEDEREGRGETLALVVVGGGGSRGGSGSGASGGCAGGGADRRGNAGGLAGGGSRGSSAGGRAGRGPSRRDGASAARGRTGADVGEEQAEVGLTIGVGHTEGIVARRKAGGSEGQRAISLASSKDAGELEGLGVGAGDEINLDGADGIDPVESEWHALTNVEGGIGNGGLCEANGGEAGKNSSSELHLDLCV